VYVLSLVSLCLITAQLYPVEKSSSGQSLPLTQQPPPVDFQSEPQYYPFLKQFNKKNLENVAEKSDAPAAISASPINQDPLNNKPWVKLVEECVDLYDELDNFKPELDSVKQEVADHVMCRLQEILERSQVNTIAGDSSFNFAHHQAGKTYKKVPPGTAILETLSPGFRIGPRVLRKAQVVLDRKEG
jgi:hypothetical protein